MEILHFSPLKWLLLLLLLLLILLILLLLLLLLLLLTDGSGEHGVGDTEALTDGQGLGERGEERGGRKVGRIW